MCFINIWNVWKKKGLVSTAASYALLIIDILCCFSVEIQCRLIQCRKDVQNMKVRDKHWYKILTVFYVFIRYYIPVPTWTLNTNCSWCTDTECCYWHGHIHFIIMLIKTSILEWCFRGRTIWVRLSSFKRNSCLKRQVHFWVRSVQDLLWIFKHLPCH